MRSSKKPIEALPQPQPADPQAKAAEPAAKPIVPPEGLTCPLAVCRGTFQTSTAEPNPELQVQTTTCGTCGAAASCDVKVGPAEGLGAGE